MSFWENSSTSVESCKVFPHSYLLLIKVWKKLVQVQLSVLWSHTGQIFFVAHYCYWRDWYFIGSYIQRIIQLFVVLAIFSISYKHTLPIKAIVDCKTNKWSKPLHLEVKCTWNVGTNLLFESHKPKWVGLTIKLLLYYKCSWRPFPSLCTLDAGEAGAEIKTLLIISHPYEKQKPTCLIIWPHVFAV